MGKYFNQMKQDLELRNYSKHTVSVYLDHMKNFIKFHMKDPSLIELEDITTYQVYLVYSKKVSYSTFNLADCSIYATGVRLSELINLKVTSSTWLRSNSSLGKVRYQ